MLEKCRLIVIFYPQTWIREKAKLIESTDELGNDLSGVITLQRRLSGLERDLAAIQAKVMDTLQC
jgi:spectrin beta